MSTNINISVGDNKLLAQASLQQNASRQAQLEKEANKRLETQATDVRTTTLATQNRDANGNSLIGTRFQNPQLERRPAANRQGGRGIFGYLPAGNSNYGFYDAYTEEAYISPSTPITYSGSKVGKYGVIKLGAPNTCLANDPDGYLFCNRSQELLQFVQKGGVLWIQNEWQNSTDANIGCGIQTSIINSYIQNLFECSIGFGLNNYANYNRIFNLPYYGDADGNFLVYQSSGFTAPPLFYTDLVSPIENGTVMYSHPAVGAVMSFEKIGKGFIVLSADSNATVEYPIGIFEGQEYTIIDALRTLR